MLQGHNSQPTNRHPDFPPGQHSKLHCNKLVPFQILPKMLQGHNTPTTNHSPGASWLFFIKLLVSIFCGAVTIKLMVFPRSLRPCRLNIHVQEG